MRRFAVAVAALCCAPLLSSCSVASSDPLCNGRVSVADFVLQFGQGLANFGDDESNTLEADSLSVLNVVLDGRDAAGGTGEAAVALSDKVADFVAAMNSWDWSVNGALADQSAVAAADALGTEETLLQANTVEALVLQKCGSVSTIAAPVQSVETLPTPAVPSPTATDPDAAAPNDQSEAYALGSAVGTMFGLTLDATQVQCLGDALQGVVDVTDSQAGPGQYASQFQTAFDGCGIKYEVTGG